MGVQHHITGHINFQVCISCQLKTPAMLSMPCYNAAFMEMEKFLTYNTIIEDMSKGIPPIGNVKNAPTTLNKLLSNFKGL